VRCLKPLSHPSNQLYTRSLGAQSPAQGAAVYTGLVYPARPAPSAEELEPWKSDTRPGASRTPLPSKGMNLEVLWTRSQILNNGGTIHAEHPILRVQGGAPLRGPVPYRRRV